MRTLRSKGGGKTGLGVARGPEEPQVERVTNEGQYSLVVKENNNILDKKSLDDPFITTIIRVRGWRAAWLALRGRLEFVVRVDGTPAASRVVFMGDYTAVPEDAPRVMECAEALGEAAKAQFEQEWAGGGPAGYGYDVDDETGTTIQAGHKVDDETGTSL